MRSANAPTNVAPDAASPAVKSAPACWEPTWLCRSSLSGSRTTPRPSADLVHAQADEAVEGDRLLHPAAARLRSPPPPCHLRTRVPRVATVTDAGRFPVERTTLPGGQEIAFVRAGAGRLPASARARMAGDEAHLVAQHRAARRRRLRGDRPRPARLRRLGPGSGRVLRPGGAREGSPRAGLTTTSATSAARLRAATSAASRSRTSGCGSTASSSASACSTRSRRSCRTNTRRPGIPPSIPREVRQAADYFRRQARRRRRARRRAGHRRRSGAATSSSSTARGSGPRRAPSTRMPSTS